MNSQRGDIRASNILLISSSESRLFEIVERIISMKCGLSREITADAKTRTRVKAEVTLLYVQFFVRS